MLFAFEIAGIRIHLPILPIIKLRSLVFRSERKCVLYWYPDKTAYEKMARGNIKSPDKIV